DATDNLDTGTARGAPVRERRHGDGENSVQGTVSQVPTTGLRVRASTDNPLNLIWVIPAEGSGHRMPAEGGHRVAPRRWSGRYGFVERVRSNSMDDSLVIAGQPLRSRLILGTGKYRTM